MVLGLAIVGLDVVFILQVWNIFSKSPTFLLWWGVWGKSFDIGSSDPIVLGRQQVQSLGFRFSSSQPITKVDGNCVLHTIFEKQKKCNHSILKNITSSQDLRLFIRSKLQSQLDENKILWVSDISPKKWLLKMKYAGVWVDNVFLQITSNVFNKISSRFLFIHHNLTMHWHQLCWWRMWGRHALLRGMEVIKNLNLIIFIDLTL